MQLLPVIFLFTQLLLSCTDLQNNAINLDKMDMVSVFDLVDSISVVQLETNNESLIGQIEKVIFKKNRYYVFDSKLHTILCFNVGGDFLFKINKRGRGPGEYDYLGDFNIDTYNNQLMILVPWGYILYYDMDGNFISKVKLPNEIIAYNEVYALNKDKLLFISLNEYQAAYYSRTNETILKRFLQIKDNLHLIFFPVNKTYSYNDSVFFNNVGINNDVLNLTDDNQPIAYSWNFGKNNNTPEQMHEALLYNQKKQDEHKPSLATDNLGNDNFPNYFNFCSFETSRYRITQLFYKDAKSFLTIFKDKKNGKDYVFRETTEGIGFSFLSTCRNSVIAYESYYLDKYFTKSILSPAQLKTVEANDPNNDNPFLVIYHFKINDEN